MIDEPALANSNPQSTSSAQTSSPVPQESTKPKPPGGLTYEETPVIEPQPEADQPLAEVKVETTPPVPEIPPSPLPPSPPPSPPKRRGGFLKTLRLLIFLGAMFAGVIWLSTIVRDFMVVEEAEAPEPTPTRYLAPPEEFLPEEATPAGSKPTEPALKTYSVISGITHQPISGLSFKLPADVLPPICDGSSCASQGTYLPGGTRFTVAARGKGQALPDFRGAILTDASGREFTMKNAVFGGRTVYEFTGDFAGTTGGGFAFSKMHGVLIPLTDTLSLELNHFAPRGITVDFTSDHVLFEQIVASVTFSEY